VERRDAQLRVRIVGGEGLEHADPPHLVRLLRARSGRPCSRRAAEKHSELAPPQMINPHVSSGFEDSIASSYSKWHIAVRGSVTLLRDAFARLGLILCSL
jgi:hypothetical protein